jgi:pimeloyl-ACP methyl ester carboxylesterase
MQSGFITLASQEQLYYEECGAEFIGQRPSLLFVHGNFSNCEWWHDTIDHLKHLKRHLIALDQRGFGKSTYLSPCHRFYDWARDLKEFCQLRGIEQCIANGWSFGGGVAMKLAEIAPELVTKVILTCSVSDKGLQLRAEGKPCLKREEIAANPKAQFMINIVENKDSTTLAQVYEGLLFKFIEGFSQEKKAKILRGCF